MKRLFTGIVCLILGGVLPLACSPAAVPTPTPQREVVVGLASDTQTVDPQVVADSTSVSVMNHIFDPLVQRDPHDMSIIPVLAESWEIKDPKTYVFKLRKGAKFHDGSEVTADDVKFTFERVNDPKSKASAAFKGYVSVLANVQAVDKYTVQFNLKSAYAPWLRRLPTFYILPQQYIKSVGDDEFARKPIGSGPYKFVEWVKDDHLRLVANDSYWKGAPEIKRVVFKPIPEASTRIAALLAGAADIIERVEPDSVSVLQQDKNVRVVSTDGNSFLFFVMPFKLKPFDDVRVRRAVSYAIDWDTTLKLFGGDAKRVPLPALPGDFGYADYANDLAKFTYNYDPDKARKLLVEAGFPNGFETNIEVPTSQYVKGPDLAQAVSTQLAQVGIKAKVQTYEWAVYYNDRYIAGKISGLGLFSMANPLFDPDHLMSVQFDPTRTTARYYNAPKLTELAQKGMTTVDTQERVKIYREAMQFILEEAPYVWGYLIKQTYATRADISWTPRADIRLFVDEASFAKK